MINHARFIDKIERFLNFVSTKKMNYEQQQSLFY